MDLFPYAVVMATTICLRKYVEHYALPILQHPTIYSDHDLNNLNISDIRDKNESNIRPLIESQSNQADPELVQESESRQSGPMDSRMGQVSFLQKLRKRQKKQQKKYKKPFRRSELKQELKTMLQRKRQGAQMQEYNSSDDIIERYFLLKKRLPSKKWVRSNDSYPNQNTL